MKRWISACSGQTENAAAAADGEGLERLGSPNRSPGKKIFWESLCRYLYTVPLFDLLVLFCLRDAFPYAGWVLLALLLPGMLFLIGMIAGAVWGGLPGLRWWMAALYSLASVLACPLQYMFGPYSGEPEWFWSLVFLLGGQQGVGFGIGAWCRMESVQDKERRSRETVPQNGGQADGAEGRRAVL